MVKHRSKKRAWRRFRGLILLALIGVAAMGGFIWWQEAPLRDAERLLQAGKANEALRRVEEWRDEHGNTDAALALRARCLVELGYDVEALRIFSAVGAETPAELHAWARAQLRSERWAQAMPLLEAVLKQRPDDPDVLHELSACSARLGMLDRAVEYAQQFAKHEEFRHRGLLMIGMLRKQQGNKAGAIEAWNQIADSDSDVQDLQVPAEDFLVECAALHIDLGHPETASGLLDRAVAIRETDDGRYYQGVVDEQLRDTAAAREHWKRALVLNPDHVRSREALARLAIADGEADPAQNYLTPLLNASQLRSSTAYLMQRISALRGDQEEVQQWTERTDALRKAERLDSAVQQMLRENPNSYWAIVVRAWQFAEAGNWDQADVMLSTLPDDGDATPEFVVKLQQAIQDRGALPPAELLPIELF